MSFFGFGGHSSSASAQAASQDDGPSLTSILSTPALRTELVLHVALITDSMRRSLLATFDSNPKPASLASRSSTADDLLLDTTPAPNDSISTQEAREAWTRRERDIRSARTQGLRRAALTHFDAWQIAVLRRLGEVLSVRPDAIRSGRAQAKQRAAAARQAREDRAFHAWAEGNENSPDQAPPGQDDAETALPDARIPSLPKDARQTVLKSLLLLLLSLESYTAPSRVLMTRTCGALDLPPRVLAEHESRIAAALLAAAAQSREDAMSERGTTAATQKHNAQDAANRRWKVGMATVAGAALIGVTGGLLAPVVAAGLGSIMGGIGLGAVATLLGPLATNAVLVGGLFGAYGGKMTGQVVEKYARGVEDFKFLPLHASPAEQHKLRVAIGVSGYLTSPEEFESPWAVLDGARIEPFALRWEADALAALGESLASVLRRYAWDFAKFQLLTVFFAGLWPLGLLRAHSVLDNPYAIARARSDMAGKVLAETLVAKVQGERPVVLVGYSLGARVVFACLRQLAEQNAFGLVEHVVLLGAPVPVEEPEWRRARAMVAGRFVNVFSRDDWILGFLERVSSGKLGVAGLQRVDGIAGVENFDATELVKGHVRYGLLVGTVLQRIGFVDLDAAEVQRQATALRDSVKMEEKTARARRSEKGEDALAREDRDGRIVVVDGDGADTVEGASNDLLGLSISGHNVDEPLPVYSPRAPSGGASAGGARQAGTPVASAAPPPVLPAAQTPVQEHDDEFTHATGGIEMVDEEESDHGPLSEVPPEPEPDYGPDRESVRFGTSEHGFNLEYSRFPR